MKSLKLLFKFAFLILLISILNGSFQSKVMAGINLNYYLSGDTARINDLARKGFKYISEKKIDKAKAYIDSALAVCKSERIETTALLNLLTAHYSFTIGDFLKASDDATRAMQQAKDEGNENVLARTYVFLGRYYLRTGFFSESLDYFTNSIDIAKKNNIRGILPNGYAGQADVYRVIKDYKNYKLALDNLIKESVKEGNTDAEIRGLYYLGTQLADPEKKFKPADSILKMCYEKALINRDTIHLSSSLANLGWVFYLQQMYDSSLVYYNKSLKFSIPGRLHSTAANAYGNIGTINRDLGNTTESLKNYKESIGQAKQVNDWYSLQWVYADMSKMYLQKKDTSRAYLYYVQFKRFNDSLIYSTNAQGTTDATLRYETDTHRKEVELLSLRIKNQRLMLYGFFGLILLTILISLLLYRGSRLKARRRISEMNQKISEITQANLRQQMNPHFIFNTLNSIQYYMYQHDKLATNNYLTKFSSLMRKVLENSQHTSIPLNDELDALTLYLELERIRFKDKFDFKINVDEEIDVLLFKVPTMLIQPYVENSICHGLIPAERNGFIEIDLKLEKDYISCSIEDNGIGREASQKRKAKSENNHNSLGTQIVSSRLDLVNALYGTSLKIIYTDLKNDKGEPEGTRVEIHIPIIT
jgi:tetratricopeptide (TPR) repeat protein